MLPSYVLVLLGVEMCAAFSVHVLSYAGGESTSYDSSEDDASQHAHADAHLVNAHAEQASAILPNAAGWIGTGTGAAAAKEEEPYVQRFAVPYYLSGCLPASERVHKVRQQLNRAVGCGIACMHANMVVCSWLLTHLLQFMSTT